MSIESKHRSYSEYRERVATTQQDEATSSVWGVYDSNLRTALLPTEKSVESSFLPVLPENQQNIREYIEQQLAPFKGHVVGIEFGGPASNLFNGFSRGFFEKTAGVNLADRRPRLNKIRDGLRNHSLIVGDMTAEETQTQLLEWMDGQHAHVIFERMMRGLEIVPHDLQLISEHVAWWYQLLAEGGVMFLQAPRTTVQLLADWGEKVCQVSEGTIEIFIGFEGKTPWPSIRLVKHPGAPQHLPILTAKEVYSSLRAQMGEHRPNTAAYLHPYYPKKRR